MQSKKISENATKVLHTLNEQAEVSLNELYQSQSISMNFNDVMLAIGWLVHDSKVTLQQSGDQIIVRNIAMTGHYFG